MKYLFLTILILSGTAANALASKMYATCDGGDMNVIVYSEGNEYGAYVVMVGNNSTFHQEAWEYSHKGKRRFSVDHNNYVLIDTQTKTGVIGIQGATSQLNCTIAANAAPPLPRKESCWSLPAWVSFEDDDGSLCPVGHIWGDASRFNSNPAYMCCPRAPI